MASRVRQLRVVLNVDDLPSALAFYRDRLGLTAAEAYSGPDGAEVVILDAGRATLELANPAQSRFIADVETGGVASTPVRLAFEVDDTVRAVDTLVPADGGESDGPAPDGPEPDGPAPSLVSAPVRTPWESLNARVLGPEGLHVTLFQELGPAAAGAGELVADLVGTTVEDDGQDLLRTLVALAGRNAEAGLEPFAAVVVRDGVVVGAGVNTADVATDPTAHAETLAVRDAARRTGSTDLRGARVLSSAEPCPVCRVVAMTAGVERVLHAAPARFVPAEIGTPDQDLVQALEAARPGWVRQETAGLSEGELRAPYEAYLHHRRTRG